VQKSILFNKLSMSLVLLMFSFVVIASQNTVTVIPSGATPQVSFVVSSEEIDRPSGLHPKARKEKEKLRDSRENRVRGKSLEELACEKDAQAQRVVQLNPDLESEFMQQVLEPVRAQTVVSPSLGGFLPKNFARAQQQGELPVLEKKKIANSLFGAICSANVNLNELIRTDKGIASYLSTRPELRMNIEQQIHRKIWEKDFADIIDYIYRLINLEIL
jgi:hypothetical protein